MEDKISEGSYLKLNDCSSLKLRSAVVVFLNTVILPTNGDRLHRSGISDIKSRIDLMKNARFGS